MAKFCKNCGSELDEGSVFCNECGTKIDGTKQRKSSSNNVFSDYKIDMIDGEEIIRHSQIHEGCLIVPGIILGIGIIIGFFFRHNICRLRLFNRNFWIYQWFYNNWSDLAYNQIYRIQNK